MYYILRDYLGTPQRIIDETGTLVWQAFYEPFGHVELLTNTITCNLRFPGQYYDSETGLHYNWNRYYDPGTGRYLTPDLVGLEGGINLYAYALSDTINLIDFSGLCWSTARAVLHYLNPFGGDIALAETECVADVSAATFNARNNWKEIVKKKAKSAALSYFCPAGGEDIVTFNDHTDLHSGVWWIGGIKLPHDATC